ncbi:MAG: hypothetical protein LUG46_05720 [Erysipelotrichaceae bacterium]|nr:hypothetical protein [Erysipelotrichaceae bacterium]
MQIFDTHTRVQSKDYTKEPTSIEIFIIDVPDVFEPDYKDEVLIGHHIYVMTTIKMGIILI